MSRRSREQSYLNPERLLHTQRGMDWLNHFDDKDQPIARKLISGLTLVSSREFEIGIKKLIDTVVDQHSGPVALYAVREVDVSRSIFDEATGSTHSGASDCGECIDAVGRGPDIGSEGRVAALITQVSRSNPSTCLNHPGINQMRRKNCRMIVLIDDLLGSGNRVTKFFRAIWQDLTIRSWASFGYVRFVVMAFAATETGRMRTARIQQIDSITTHRVCPTFRTLPWPQFTRRTCSTLCKAYSIKTRRPNMALGYDNIMASLVFEHGCPNNTPSILWAEASRNRSWTPLFPNRAIQSAEHSVFPPEIARREPASVLIDAGQTRLAQRSREGQREPATIALIILALIAKGYRRDGSLIFATGLSNRELERHVQRCTEIGWITISRRITPLGVSELNSARRRVEDATGTPPIGEDYYFPKALREITHG